MFIHLQASNMFWISLEGLRVVAGGSHTESIKKSKKLLAILLLSFEEAIEILKMCSTLALPLNN
jgi:hypothetical protein